MSLLENYFANTSFESMSKLADEFVAVRTLLSTDDVIDFTDPGEPLLLKGAINQWPALHKWTFDFLSEKYGDLQVTANLYSGSNRIQINLKDLIEQILLDETNAPYLQEWWYELDCPELSDDIIIPTYFSDDFSSKFLGFKNSHIWIGGGSSSTPFHQDETAGHVWSAQVYGIKRWIFIDPDIKVSHSDFTNFSIRKFKSEFDGAVKFAEVLPGDILFLPSKWWHSVHSLGPTITLRNVYVPENLAKEYLQGLFGLSLTLALKRNTELLANSHLRDQLEIFCKKLDLTFSKFR